MAKGTIKVAGSSTGTGVRTSITVTTDNSSATKETTYISTTPVGDVVKGILNDVNDPKVDIEFIQPYGMELGLAVGMKVNYTPLNIGGKIIANSVHLLEKGTIETLNDTNDGGILIDKSCGKQIPFVHFYCKETGLMAPTQDKKGSVVSFERVIDPKTAGYIATALELIK